MKKEDIIDISGPLLTGRDRTDCPLAPRLARSVDPAACCNPETEDTETKFPREFEASKIMFPAWSVPWTGKVIMLPPPEPPKLTNPEIGTGIPLGSETCGFE